MAIPTGRDCCLPLADSSALSALSSAKDVMRTLSMQPRRLTMTGTSSSYTMDSLRSRPGHEHMAGALDDELNGGRSWW
jgi:hypothetical protein